MKIKSNFKDYYDHVAHIYGGGDPLNLYLRLPIKDELGTLDLKVTEEKSSNLLYSIWTHDRMVNNTQLKILSVCGKCFLLAKKDKELDFKIFNVEDFKDSAKKLFSRICLSKKEQTIEVFVNKNYSFLDDLSKAIKSPVFMINSFHYEKDKVWRFNFDLNIPILYSYGIPKYIEANQLYQDISQYITSKIKDNPDTFIPEISSNSDKILQHGFDLKSSFRPNLKK